MVTWDRTCRLRLAVPHGGRRGEGLLSVSFVDLHPYGTGTNGAHVTMEYPVRAFAVITGHVTDAIAGVVDDIEKTLPATRKTYMGIQALRCFPNGLFVDLESLHLSPCKLLFMVPDPGGGIQIDGKRLHGKPNQAEKNPAKVRTDLHGSYEV